MNPPKNHFHRINFREFYYSAILYRIIYNFCEFYFCESQKIAKRAKVTGLESFQLYSIIVLIVESQYTLVSYTVILLIVFNHDKHVFHYYYTADNINTV